MVRAGFSVEHDRRNNRALPWRVAGAAVVLAGVVAQIARPLAPDLGAVPDPARWFDAHLLTRVAAYRGPLRVAGVVLLLIDLVVPLSIACTGTGRRAIARMVATAGAHRPVRAATAVTLAIVLAIAALRLPLDLWAYRHARVFGLSTQFPGAWLLDWGLARALELLTVGSLAVTGYALARRRPADWAAVAAPLGVAVLTTLALVGPLLIEPLWFRITSLPDGPVRRQVTAVLEAAGNPQAPLLVADASRRSIRQNAYVSGLAGTRRVVLYDTLLERAPEEVALVVAHELVHARNHDLARGVAAGGAGWVIACGVVAATLRLRVRTGRQQSVADPHGAAAAFAVIVVLMVVATPLGAWVSRRAEAAADLGALQLTNRPGVYCAMQRGFVERNLTEPAPPDWQRLWSATHPPPVSRLLMAETFTPGVDPVRAAGPALTATSACG